MLIKSIRNAPATLKWFRSDLTQVNIEMMTKGTTRNSIIELEQKQQQNIYRTTWSMLW